MSCEADFLHANDLGSDTDDEDYDPGKDEAEAAKLSEEEDGGEDHSGDEGGKGRKKKRRRGKKKNGSSSSSAPLSRGVAPGSSSQEEEETAKMKEEFAREKEEKKELEEKAKVDDLWADFKKDVKPKKKVPSTGSGLGSLGSLSSSSSTKKASSSAKKTSSSSGPPRSIVSSIFDSIPSKSSSSSSNGDTKEEEEDPSKVKITRVFDFAGENVAITKEVDADSAEAKKFQKQQEKAAAEASKNVLKRPSGVGGGLASVVGSISGKKQKMGCLDKSKLDWNQFVREEGIKEELETHNKGKDGYVERQEFMERSDLRRFELEKEAREKTRKTLNR